MRTLGGDRRRRRSRPCAEGGHVVTGHAHGAELVHFLRQWDELDYGKEWFPLEGAVQCGYNDDLAHVG